MSALAKYFLTKAESPLHPGHGEGSEWHCCECKGPNLGAAALNDAGYPIHGAERIDFFHLRGCEYFEALQEAMQQEPNL